MAIYLNPLTNVERKPDSFLAMPLTVSLYNLIKLCPSFHTGGRVDCRLEDVLVFTTGSDQVPCWAGFGHCDTPPLTLAFAEGRLPQLLRVICAYVSHVRT